MTNAESMRRRPGKRSDGFDRQAGRGTARGDERTETGNEERQVGLDADQFLQGVEHFGPLGQPRQEADSQTRTGNPAGKEARLALAEPEQAQRGQKQAAKGGKKKSKQEGSALHLGSSLLGSSSVGLGTSKTKVKSSVL